MSKMSDSTERWFWMVLTLAALLFVACVQAKGAELPPQTPLPEQMPSKPYCLCWRDGHCDCGVCTCPGGRKLLTADSGRKVWFKQVDGQWVPDEPGWSYDAGLKSWHRPPHAGAAQPAPQLAPQLLHTPVFRQQFFHSFGGGGGMMRGGRNC